MATSQIKTAWTVAFSTRPGQAARARAVYELTDPYAVQLHLPNGRHEPIVWTFARDLLNAGLQARGAAVGEGDLSIGRAKATEFLAITLFPQAPDPLTVFARRDEVTSFLAQTFRRVPSGQEDEWMDWDSSWKQLTWLVRRPR